MKKMILLATSALLLLNAASSHAEEITSVNEYFLEDQTTQPPSTSSSSLFPQENAVQSAADKSDLSTDVSLFDNILSIPDIDVIDGKNVRRLDNVEFSVTKSQIKTEDNQLIDKLYFTLIRYKDSGRASDSLNSADLQTGTIALQDVQNGNYIFTKMNLKTLADESTEGKFVFELSDFEGIDATELADSNRASVTPLLNWAKKEKELGSIKLPNCSKLVKEQKCVKIWGKKICTDWPVIKTAAQKGYVKATYMEPVLNPNFLSQQNVFNAISDTLVTGVRECLALSLTAAGISAVYSGGGAALTTFKATLSTCASSKINTFASDVAKKLTGGSQSKDQILSDAKRNITNVSIKTSSSCAW